MTDRPILFSAPMVRALLDGRKTQTRRVLSPGNGVFGSAPRDFWQHADLSRATVDGRPESGQYLHVPCHRDYVETGPSCDCERCAEMGWEGTVHRLWPRTEVGDRLWVREIWRPVHSGDPARGAHYRADHPDDWCDDTKWKPGIHMFRWASRLTLHVTEVRVQRLQEISAADAEAEGVFRHVAEHSLDHIFRGERAATAVRYYAELWERINGKGSWDANPWVVALTFTVENANIDAARVAA